MRIAAALSPALDVDDLLEEEGAARPPRETRADQLLLVGQVRVAMETREEPCAAHVLNEDDPHGCGCSASWCCASASTPDVMLGESRAVARICSSMQLLQVAAQQRGACA